MTRFETTVVLAIVAGLAALHSPAFGQFVIIGDDDTPKAVNSSAKGDKGKAKPPEKSRRGKVEEPAKPEEPTFTVAGGFLKTKEKAKESAILAAVEKWHMQLLDEQPQVTRYPTTEMVRKMLVRHPQASEADAEIGKVTEQQIEVGGKTETMYQVEVAVKVKPESVRALRSRERSSEALWVLAGLGGLAAVVAGFFKVDAWTKGYLTSWLVLGTVGAATLLGGLWWWAK